MTIWGAGRYASRLASDKNRMTANLRLVFSTCSSTQQANEIAQILVERRLAACVNVLPAVRSTYRWLGKIECDDEVLLMIKTAEPELDAIANEIKARTNYELPELIAVEITGGSADYLAWVAASVGGTGQ